jgi:uncharacterized protein YukE
MPINTVVAGNPDAVAATGVWLRTRLAAAVHDTSAILDRVQEMTRTTWRGPAAQAFGDRMGRIHRNSDTLATDAEAAAVKFGDLADALRAAQTVMARARDAAVAGGLSVAGGVIAEPTAPPMCFVDPALEAAAVQRHQQQVDAYNAALEAARGAVEILAGAWRGVQEVWNDIVEKKYLSAADFVGKGAQHLLDQHVSALTDEAGRLRDEAFTAQQRTLESSAGSPDAEFHEQVRQESSALAADLRERIGGGSLGQFVLAAIDRGVTVGQIAVDIAHGKSPGQAIASNVTGAAAGDFVGGLVAEALTTRGVGIAAAAVLTGGTAVIVGAAAGLVADVVWNDVVPQGVRDKIDKGARELFDAGKTVVTGTWHAAENLAETVWHALF